VRLGGRRSVDWSAFRPEQRSRRALLDYPALTTTVWAVAAFFGLVGVLNATLPKQVPFGLLLFGIVIGSINALIAVGLILIYRANRIINFALAEIGVFGAILFENLIRSAGLPWIVALPMGVAASAALGGLLEYVVIRRFTNAPRLILTVATIGLAQIVVVFTYGVTRLFDVQTGSTLHTPLSDWNITVNNVRFSGDAVLLVAAVPVIVFALNVFLKGTDFGVAVRAAAESSDRASLLGVPVRRVSTVMWVVACGVTGLATMLRSPVVGVITGASVQGPGLLLRALAAAVLARMTNIRVAVVAAIFVGVIEQALYYAYGGSTVSDVVFVAIIIAGLLLPRKSVGRAEEAADGSWLAVDEVRPVPDELRRLPEVRFAKWALFGVIAAAAAALPVIAPPSKENLAAAVVIYSIVAVSLVVLTGWAGQISLGQFGIVGFAAALSAKMSADFGVDFLVSMGIGAIAGSTIALLLGAAALRIKGFYFAVTSLGFAVAMETYFLNDSFFPHLVPKARPERPVIFGRWNLESEAAFYLFSLVVLVLVIVAVRAIRNSRTGRVLVAVRDNEKSAQAYGIDHIRAKLTAFALSGAIAGIAGSLFAVHQHAVSSSAYSPNEGLRVFSMVVIGGLGSVPGAILGAVFVRGSAYLLSNPFLAILTTGVGLLVVVMVLPGGIGRVLYSTRDRYLRWVARRHELVVPSLLADVRVEEPKAVLDLRDQVVEELVEDIA
jgi:branched-chain amino acid transport system permease protein